MWGVSVRVQHTAARRRDIQRERLAEAALERRAGAGVSRTQGRAESQEAHRSAERQEACQTFGEGHSGYYG